ncbi:hypothetical protein PGB90_007672 [Kerria lacca]
MRKPNYDTELHEKLTIINCIMSKSDIKNFLTKIFLRKDRVELEIERNQLINQCIQGKKIINESEWKILHLLSDEEDILENEDIVNCISTNAALIDDNTNKLSQINIQLESTNATIYKYIDNIKYFSDLYEILENLNNLNSTYQFSLKWFENLINVTIDHCNKIEKSEKRYKVLNKLFYRNFYFYTCHSLTEMDKIIFEYLLAIHSVKEKKYFNEKEFIFFLDCLKEYGNEIDDCTSSQLMSLDKIKSLRSSKIFEDVLLDITRSKDEWDHSLLTQNRLPVPWESKLNNIQKLILKSCLLSQKIMSFILDFIKDEFSSDYIEPENLDLVSIYKQSNCCVPIAVVVFKNFDPIKELFIFAADNGITLQKCIVITINNEERFLKTEILDSAKNDGSWIIVRNIQHVRKCFGELEKIFELLTPITVHPDFRLWLILENGVYCPQFIFENCLIISDNTLKMRNFNTMRQELKNRLKFKEDSEIKFKFEYFLYNNLNLFHTTLSQSISTFNWNETHQFDDIDLQIAFNEICSFFENCNEEMSSKSLINLIIECSYNSKITNEWNRLYLKTILKDYWSQKIIKKLIDSSSSASAHEQSLVSYHKCTTETLQFIQRLLSVLNWLNRDAVHTYNAQFLEYSRSFLTLNLLQYCSEYNISINKVNFDIYEISQNDTSLMQPHEIKISLNGLQLLNAFWNNINHKLEERELQTWNKMPTISALVKMKSEDISKKSTYLCPIYKTNRSLRGQNQENVLITTIILPTMSSPENLIKRRVQMIVNDPF